MAIQGPPRVNQIADLFSTDLSPLLYFYMYLKLFLDFLFIILLTYVKYVGWYCTVLCLYVLISDEASYLLFFSFPGYSYFSFLTLDLVCLVLKINL